MTRASCDGATWTLMVGSGPNVLEFSGIVNDHERLVRFDRQLSYARQVRASERAVLMVKLEGGQRRKYAGSAGEVLACLCEVFQGRLPEKSNKKR